MQLWKTTKVIASSVPGLMVSAARYWILSIELRFTNYLGQSFDR
jgi:hypothetical protein